VINSTVTAPERASLLQIDSQRFQERFDRQPFLVRHRLDDHPLFSLPRLIELARALPEDQVEYNAGDVPVSLDPTRTPRTGLSIDETIRRIEECRSWMVFKNVERDPAYAALLDTCLPVRGSRGFAYAEVTAGGVPLDQVDSATMESRLCPGLYFAGEILDVDGRLGGFNFQWAWSSAWVAASAIGRRLRG